jgi:hypothetical protein
MGLKDGHRDEYGKPDELETLTSGLQEGKGRKALPIPTVNCVLHREADSPSSTSLGSSCIHAISFFCGC